MRGSGCHFPGLRLAMSGGSIYTAGIGRRSRRADGRPLSGTMDKAWGRGVRGEGSRIRWGGAPACRAEPRKHLLTQQGAQKQRVRGFREHPPWAAVARAWHAGSVLAREERELGLRVRLTSNVSADHVPATERKALSRERPERFRSTMPPRYRAPFPQLRIPSGPGCPRFRSRHPVGFSQWRQKQGVRM